MTDALDRDALARSRAIDPAASFIVQAPAGSGKTSLLTQRFLRLLAVAARPEEILAITFTRKAAAEMRHRVVAALTAAAQPLADDAGRHERRTWELARAALQNSHRLGWELERHSSRLQIQTIDGLNHWLSSRLPLSARLALSPRLLDDARPLYVEAAQRFVARMEREEELAAPIARLVRLLDHDAARLAELLADMLGRREIWLPKVLELRATGHFRQGMESLLRSALESGLRQVRARLCAAPARGLLECVSAAARHDPSGPLAPLAGLGDWPAPTAQAEDAWTCLADLLLTGQDEFRKKVDKRQGFPPQIKDTRERFTTLLAGLAAEPGLARELAALRRLPPPRYTDEQWSRIDALCEALVQAAAELQAVFAEQGAADHAAIAAAARQALGGEQAPTDLAQALEYRIRHVLVDEYQDTSPAQQRLLERLVAGWQPGDGHSLFCVGDPMQSIYGFREADVTLFLEATREGIGSVSLEPQSLTRNFRSCRGVVDWVNRAFGSLMPAVADFESGAVPYTASECTREDESGAGVHVHALLGDDDGAAARATVDAVESALSELDRRDPTGGSGPQGGGAASVAVLVRSRSALPPILAELRRRGVAYRGVELEGLSDRPAVKDLLALARALLHPGDRTAWLAVLRAPWCGLSLADLHALAAPERDAPLVDRLQDPTALEPLSGDGRQRIARSLPVLRAALRDRGRQSLGSWLRSCWLALGGPATVTDVSDLDNVDACLVALDRLADEAGPVPSAGALEKALAGLMASPVGAVDSRVQLMTLHKAKGLEFDTVILPALERRVSGNRRQLLYWAPVAVEDGSRGVVLASRGGPDEAGRGDRLENWMKHLEHERDRLELGRLAYVAATRARRSLHLVGQVGLDTGEEGESVLRTPPPDSLLGFFWDLLEEPFRERLQQSLAGGEVALAQDAGPPRRSAPLLQRLPLDWRPPAAAADVVPTAPARSRSLEAVVRPRFEWAGEEAIAVGTLVHAELDRLLRAGHAASQLRPRADAWRQQLRRLGLPEGSLPGALARIEAAIARVSASATAARLLDPQARDASSELALTAALEGRLVSVKIDRSFVDEDGLRWIVDWKTSSHEGADVGQFLQQEARRYATQLERYSRVMSLYDPRPQRIGLYFPLLDAWQEWLP